MNIKVIKDYGSIPSGSVFRLDKESKLYYYGLWSSMFGSYNVKVPKKYCEVGYIAPYYDHADGIIIEIDGKEYRFFYL